MVGLLFLIHFYNKNQHPKLIFLSGKNQLLKVIVNIHKAFAKKDRIFTRLIIDFLIEYPGNMFCSKFLLNDYFSASLE